MAESQSWDRADVGRHSSALSVCENTKLGNIRWGGAVAYDERGSAWLEPTV